MVSSAQDFVDKPYQTLVEGAAGIATALPTGNQAVNQAPTQTPVQSISARPRLNESYARLASLGWRIVRRPERWSDAYADIASKTLYINTRVAGLAEMLDWVERAVRQAYQADERLRLQCIREKAFSLFHSPGPTDLAKMAALYQWAVWFWDYSSNEANAEFLMTDMTLILTEKTANLASDQQPSLCIFDGPIRVSADSLGFKRRFRDDSNQVRHATASIEASLRYGLAGLTMMQQREQPRTADYRLNKACRAIAIGLEGERPGWQADQIERILLRELGEPAETMAWSGPPDGDPGPD